MTTIVLVRKHNDVVVASDGQVSMGNTVIKKTANKVRKIEKRNVIAGFAGSTADALTLFERLESKLEKHAGNLTRAAVELAKDWRTDKYLSVRQSLASSTAALVKFPACFSNLDSNLSNKVNASAVDPANPAITFLFSIFLTLLAVFLITVFPILTWPSLATTTSLCFLTNTIVVMIYKWILNLIVQAQV